MSHGVCWLCMPRGVPAALHDLPALANLTISRMCDVQRARQAAAVQAHTTRHGHSVGTAVVVKTTMTLPGGYCGAHEPLHTQPVTIGGSAQASGTAAAAVAPRDGGGGQPVPAGDAAGAGVLGALPRLGQRGAGAQGARGARCSGLMPVRQRMAGTRRENKVKRTPSASQRM